MFSAAKLPGFLVIYLWYHLRDLSYICIQVILSITFMEDTAIPYELPEVENHSFFFIDQRVTTSIEAKLHRHDAWELYYVVHGYGKRMAEIGRAHV